MILAGLIFYDGEKNEVEKVDKKVVETKEIPKLVNRQVPFTPQAPKGNWNDVKEGNGCEEASILMAYSWAVNKEIDLELAAKEIVEISDFSWELLGHFHDISNEDTLKLMKTYFKFDKAALENKTDLEEMKSRLAEGKILIVAVNGNELGNPNYQIPSPANHKIVVSGYDDNRREFITNDPGTSKGEGFRYPYDQLLEAITDYPTGYRESFEEIEKTMIVVGKDG